MANLADVAKVMAAIERRGMTVAQLAAEVSLPLRRAYRILRAMQAAGFAIEERPDPRRSARDGRVPHVYRMRRRSRA